MTITPLPWDEDYIPTIEEWNYYLGQVGGTAYPDGLFASAQTLITAGDAATLAAAKAYADAINSGASQTAAIAAATAAAAAAQTAAMTAQGLAATSQSTAAAANNAAVAAQAAAAAAVTTANGAQATAATAGTQAASALAALANPGNFSLIATAGTAADTFARRFGRTLWLEDFGAVGDGVTDDTAAIQAALNSGRTIRARNATYAHGQLVLSISGTRLIGSGRGAPHDVVPLGLAATTFQYIGPNGGTSLAVGPIGSNVQKLTDIEVSGISLVSGVYPYSSAAAYGLLMTSTQNSRIDIFTTEFTGAALAMTVRAGLSEAGNCEGNEISLRFRQINTPGTALQLGGNVNSNTCHNLFLVVYGYIQNGIGIDFQDADNNRLEQVWIDRVSGGTGTNLVFRGAGGPRAGNAPGLGGGRTNVIEQFSQSVDTGRIYSEGTEVQGVTSPAYANRIRSFDNANVAITNTIGTGSTFFWSSNLNPDGMREAVTNPSDGRRQLSDGTILFWGSSTAQFGAGQQNGLSLPFGCSKIVSLQASYIGNGAAPSCYAAASGNTFTIYSNATGYHGWSGVALV